MNTKRSTTIFSLKFNSNNEDFEIIPENSNRIKKVDNVNKTNSREYQINYNTEKRTERNNYPCTKCGEQFNSLKLRNDHACIYSAPKNNVNIVFLRTCANCNKTYKRLAVYTKHIKQCTTPKQIPITCPIDRKMCFCCEEPLALAHNGNFNCKKCSKSFMTQKGLKRHVLFLHSESSEFKCELCDNQCANNNILKLHRQAHSMELDRLEKSSFEYKCCICDRTFLEGIALNIHLTTHEQEHGKQALALYQCRTCQKTVETYDALMKHTCGTKYKCKWCEKLLSSKGFLRRHINTHKKYNEIVTSDDDSNVSAGENSNVIDFEKSTFQPQTELTTSTESAIVIKDEKNLLEVVDNDTIINGSNVALDDIEPSEKDLEIIMDILVNESCISYDSFPMDDITLKDSVSSLLGVLLETDLLEQFGWPTTPIDHVLEGVIKHCDITPITSSDFATQIRENVKLLLTEVIDDDSIKQLLNIKAVDTIIREIIKNSS